MERADVVVVGAGTAAQEAAAAACQSGAERVIMLEKAPEERLGGNGRHTPTGFRFVHSGKDEIRGFLRDVPEEQYALMNIPPYTEDDFYGDLMRVTQGRMDKELARLLVSKSNEALHWLDETGIRFVNAHNRTVNGKIHFDPGQILCLSAHGEQLAQWLPINANLGVDLRCDSSVTGLLGNSHRIEGVRVLGPDGEYEIEAPAIILCSGGFQADAEKRARYLGPNADIMKVRGSRYNTGEVTMMALDLGAKPSGQWQGAHASPIDASAPDREFPVGLTRYGYVFGITVNELGERFFDEGEAESGYTYAKTGRRIIEQPGGVAYQIFDQQVVPVMRVDYKPAPHVEADTIRELAEKVGIQPDLLEHTINEFNDSVRTDIDFDPSRRDGKSTIGITPPKSNWATKIDHPPFLAYAVSGAITFTFGGLAVNANAQVLNKNDDPIAGLYASGDNLGLFYFNYPSFSGQTRNVVFSRIAGEHAVSASA